MPSVKQGGGYTLTFSKKNQDVKKILADKQERGIKITDYLCEAVRAFENNKSNFNTVNVDIAKLIKEQVAIALGEADKIQEAISLEEDLEDINIDDD